MLVVLVSVLLAFTSVREQSTLISIMITVVCLTSSRERSTSISSPLSVECDNVRPFKGQMYCIYIKFPISV